MTHAHNRVANASTASVWATAASGTVVRIKVTFTLTKSSRDTRVRCRYRITLPWCTADGPRRVCTPSGRRKPAGCGVMSHRKQKSQAMRLAFSMLKSLLSFLHFNFFNFRTVQQFDQCHRRVVADAEAELQHAQVAARTGSVTRAEHFEQLRDRITIAQAVERQTTICQRRLLAERNQRLDDLTEFFRLRQRGLDDFVLNQRVGHITEHCQTVAARAVQFPQTMTVTHVNSFDSKFWSSSSIALEPPEGSECTGR
ncbi:conserved hypothetical protein [Paraburkholderia ribeironis]|uniref:Uncharacterized protein n=1 Tax=Paraburkholderia ribeironis TaxID=1247936 RepID=A0A1N7RNQ3_9BURK|nr:conserved hypothetical protein [Paraburkholderia ribeironis]